jgi:dipeptidyl aminopeptidase/acylaminoacyl peptidase
VAPRADPKTQALLSNELNVTRETPPTILVHAKDDKNVNYENSVVMYEALQKQGIPSELKLYAEGGHGFGLGRNGTDSEKWTDDFVSWLHKMKFIPPPTT